jgi:hypothetical protein
METNKENIPPSFKEVHQELKFCMASVGKLFKQNLTEEFGFKKENLDTIYSFYEIWFLLLSGIDIRSYSLLKNNEIRERLFIYLGDEMFRDLGIENKKQKSEIIVAMNTRLEEYSNVIKESKEFNKDITLLFIKKLTHAIMKKDFLNQPNMGLFPLQEQIVLEIYVDCAVFYIKSFNVFLDTILATSEQFGSLDENQIEIIKKEAQEKRKEFSDKIIMGEQVMKQNLFGG